MRARTSERIEPISKGSFDAVIVGAGPAGCMAARRLAGRKVLLIEARRLPRRKACGGALNPYSMRFLESLGLPARLLLEPDRINFRFVDWDRSVSRPTALEFRNVSRFGFDEWLTAQLPKSIELMDDTTLVDVEQSGDRVRLLMKSGAREFRAESRYLVGADGARSKVREAIIAPGATQLYLTVQDWLPLRGDLPAYFDCIGTKRIGGGFAYGYVMPKGELVVVGSVFYPGAKSLPAVHEAFRSMVAEVLPIGDDVVRREGGAALRVTSARDVLLGGGRIMLAGEAAGLISPTSGEGISYALHSGDLCGLAVTECNGDAAAKYERLARPIVRNILGKARKLPLLENRLGQIALTCVPYRLLSGLTKRL